MCVRGGESRLHVEAGTHIQEDTMHPDIAYSLVEMRRAEFLAEAAQQRLVHSARAARTPRTSGRSAAGSWRRILRLGAMRTT
jgi:hypothetical protein